MCIPINTISTSSTIQTISSNNTINTCNTRNTVTTTSTIKHTGLTIKPMASHRQHIEQDGTRQ